MASCAFELQLVTVDLYEARIFFLIYDYFWSSFSRKDIDIYMQPLIKDLKELWVVGVETYNSLSNQTFQMHVALLWTVSNFPAYAMLSGWSTKGKLVCPFL